MTTFHSADGSRKVLVNFGMTDLENPFIGSRVMRCGYAGGQTGRQRELRDAHSCSLCRLAEKDI